MTALDTAEIVRAAVAAGESDPKSRPLFRPVEAAQPYPLDALDPKLHRAAAAVQDRTRAPAALCAQSVLGAASLAVQAHADVVLPSGEQTPISLYLMTVAESGERKSAADNLAQRGVIERESKLRADHQAVESAWRNEKEAWDKARNEAIGQKVKGREAKRLALEEVGPEPPAPLVPMLTVDEPTFEGLFKLFQQGQPTLGLFAGEAATFLGGHGMAEDAKTRMAGGLTHLYDGKPIRRTRAGEHTILSGRRLSVHLMAQPAVAALLTRDPLIAGTGGQGLLNRFLIVAPETAAGTRFF